MSDIQGKGYDVEIVGLGGESAEKAIDEARRLLAGIPSGLKHAVGSAVKRAATSGTAYAAKAVREEYLIHASDFKKYTHHNTTHIESSNGSTELSITYRGYHIPLLKFDTQIGKDGRISARVKRSSAKEVFQNAFRQAMPTTGHVGIFERVYDDENLPIRELFGPSVPQMMSYNEGLRTKIAEKTKEMFDKRLEHEVNAILNGWRR